MAARLRLNSSGSLAMLLAIRRASLTKPARYGGAYIGNGEIRILNELRVELTMI